MDKINIGHGPEWREHMYILTERGQILQQYSRYDAQAVPAAYTWIRNRGFRIMSVQFVQGYYYVIVSKI